MKHTSNLLFKMFQYEALNVTGSNVEVQLTPALLGHQIIPLPIKPVVSPTLAAHLPLTLKRRRSDREDKDWEEIGNT